MKEKSREEAVSARFQPLLKLLIYPERENQRVNPRRSRHSSHYSKQQSKVSIECVCVCVCGTSTEDKTALKV